MIGETEEESDEAEEDPEDGKPPAPASNTPAASAAAASSSSPAPITGKEWVPDKTFWKLDDAVPECMMCNEKFSTFLRRHHCRSCGKVACGNCSSKKLPLPRLGYPNPERVCDPCYVSLTTPADASPKKAPTPSGKGSTRQAPRDSERPAKEELVRESVRQSVRESMHNPSGTFPRADSKATEGAQLEKSLDEIYASIRALVLESPTLIQLENGREAQEVVFTKVFDKLVQDRKLPEALLLVDTYLTFPAPDFLLTSLAEKHSLSSWRYLIRVRDKRLAATLVLKWLRLWPLDVCLDLLSMCKYHLVDDKALHAQVSEQYTRYKLYEAVLKTDRSWNEWQDLEETLRADPIVVIKKLLQERQFELAKKLTVTLSLPVTLLKEIDSSHLEALLEQNDTISAFRKIETLGDHAIEICEDLFHKITKYQTKLFLVSYLLNNLRNELTLESYNRLYSEELGIKILVRMPLEEHQKYKHLVAYPNLIVENLLMHKEIAQVLGLMKEFAELRNDNLVARYAAKALTMPYEIRGKQFPAVWRLNGDPDHDTRLRDSFVYPGVPSIDLSKQLLTLCSTPHRAGQACLSLCDKLSTKISLPDPDIDVDLVINIIQQLLFHAKVTYLKSYEQSHSFVELCDTYIGHVDLLQILVSSNCGQSVSLADLNEPSKARVLRDNLIRDDRLKLAMEVASKCRIETEPVWAAWGILKLKMGTYEDAKEKFKHTLVPFKENVQGTNLRLLNNIIEALEGGEPLETDDVKTLQGHLTRSLNSLSRTGVMNGLTGGDVPKEYSDEMVRLRKTTRGRQIERVSNYSTLDTERLRHCVYYLTTYGPPKLLVSFYVKHGLLDKACEQVLEQGLSHQAFIDEVLQVCLTQGMLPDLKTVFAANEKMTTDFQPYLLAACRHYHQQNKQQLLYVLQIFMGDHLRAAMSCVKIFLKK